MPLSRDDILNAPAPEPILELVEVPEWGGSVNVGIMSGSQRDRYEIAITGEGNKVKDNIRALMVVYAARDEHNRSIFSEKDVPRLKEMSSIALDRIYKAGWKLNRMGPEAVDDAAVGESDPAPS